MRRVRRACVRLLAGVAAFTALGIAAAPAASAHPLGNFTINRYSGLTVGVGRLDVTYVVDMAEIPTFQEMPNIDTNGDRTVSSAERRAWLGGVLPRLARGVRATVDGRALQLSPACGVVSFRAGQANAPILRLQARLSAALPEAGELAFEDSNYRAHRGWKEVSARAVGGARIVSSDVPSSSVSGELRAYPKDMLASPLAVTTARVSFTGNVRTGGAARARACGPARAAPPPPVASNFFASLVTWRLTPFVFGLSLLLAAGAGALHALLPGHGKTITAAYLVGSGARVRQAVSVGAAVSLMHTGSVLALGLFSFFAFRRFAAEAVYPWLGLLTGLVAVALGGALMLVRVRARRAATAPEAHGATHSHDHPHPHGRPHGAPQHAHRDDTGASDGRRSAVSRPRLAALALAGGALPSPTAVVVLTGAIATGRVGYGLALIVAFSAGLAAALTLVGLVSLRARSAVSRRLGEHVAVWLPVGSAAVIVAFGLFFTARAAAQIL